MLLLVFSFLMFIWQTSVAIMNLMDPAVVDSTEILSMADLEPPLITICPIGQWNTTLLWKNGYLSKRHLLLGYESLRTVSLVGWGAKHNLTFAEMVGKVTNFNLSNTKFIVEIDNKRILDFHYEIKFYPGYGYCFDFVNLPATGKLQISLKETDYKISNVYITDRKLKTRNTFFKESLWGSKIVLKRDQAQEYIVKVNQLSNFDPRNPDNCKEYENDDYEVCVDDELQKVFKPLINCNPPWLSSKDQCDGVMNNTTETVYSLGIKTHETVDGIENMKTYPAKRNCMKACTVIQPNIYYGNEEKDDWLESTTLKLIFTDQVVYTTKVLAYGPSTFLIDMGSSLGLWFGLSVFGITDLGITAFQWVKNTNQRVIKKFMN